MSNDQSPNCGHPVSEPNITAAPLGVTPNPTDRPDPLQERDPSATPSGSGPTNEHDPTGAAAVAAAGIALLLLLAVAVIGALYLGNPR